VTTPLALSSPLVPCDGGSVMVIEIDPSAPIV
jgi:hypothetical protein